VGIKDLSTEGIRRLFFRVKCVIARRVWMFVKGRDDVDCMRDGGRWARRRASREEARIYVRVSVPGQNEKKEKRCKKCG
jgi:hypothetical protein